MLWLTKSIVRPLLRHVAHPAEARRWNSASPTASTSSTIRISGSRIRRDGEREPHVHPARVALHGRVDEPLYAGELDDVVELPPHLGFAHAEDRAVQEDVLAARELGVEAGADLEQRPDAAADVRVALGGLGDARKNLEERRLPGSVLAHDRDRLALLHLEGDVAQRPHHDTLVVA